MNKDLLIKRIPKKHQEIVEKGLTFAEEYYDKEKRINGQTYFEHSLDLACIVIDLGLDVNSVLVSLLHHVLYEFFINEDFEANFERIKKEVKDEFGQEVLNMLLFLTKISYLTRIEAERESMTKFILKDCDDLRVLLIRLSDKILNSRTVDVLPGDLQINDADKMLHLYSPLSEYVNLHQYKSEFDSIAFRLLHPDEYREIDDFLKNNSSYNEKVLDRIITKLEADAGEVSDEVEVFGRVKSHYSIYKKTNKYVQEGKDPDLGSIKDVLAFSVLTNKTDNCYKVLSDIQSDPDIDITSIADYVIEPKPNGYSAIHLIAEIAVPEIDDIIETEIQVLTFEMYHRNTYGSASHFAYKQQGLRYARPSGGFEWVKNVRDSVSQVNSSQMVLSNPIKTDIFIDRVFVFTPKGDIVDLPNGATVADFAFSIHSDIGFRMTGAKVNGRQVPLDRELKDGDAVEIIVSNNPKTKSKVNENWLNYAKTDRAKKKIIKELTRKWK